jgi:uncharacterized protein DUF1707
MPRRRGELRVAFAQGRLTRVDLDQRAGRALLARTYAELDGAAAHIPARPAPVRPRGPRRADWPPPALAAPGEDAYPDQRQSDEADFFGLLGAHFRGLGHLVVN